MRSVILLCCTLAIVTLGVYWPAGHHDFVNIDDVSYVVNNPHVATGLSQENINWAFTSIDQSNWHPLTWLSHMVDVELFGMNPRGHHFTNIAIHIATALLLFILLVRLSATLWQSAFVAALFALHPLHVESVAWVAERKDVLSAFFLCLTLLLYAEYAQGRRRKFYIFALLAFACGLMAKPMLVTLPVVMLLIDFWPLQRFQTAPKESGHQLHTVPFSVLIPLLKEKIPFFALAVVSSAITIHAQNKGGSLQSIDLLAPGLRIGNAATAYVKYLYKTFSPTDLAVFYPFPESIPLWQVIGSLLILLAISVAVLRSGRSHPYLVTGWFWFLVTLLPVIGLVQVGLQSMADRYTYIPLIGLFMVVAWGIPALLNRFPYRQGALILLAAIVLTVSMTMTWRQLACWRNSETLFRQALRVTSANFVAHYNLGLALVGKGDLQGAMQEFQQVVAIKPDHVLAYNNMGYIHAEQREYDQAIAKYRKSLEINPTYTPAYNNLGVAYDGKGQVDEAIRHYQKALMLNPEYSDAHNNLGVAWSKKGFLPEAIKEYEKALAINPNYADAQYNLRKALERQRFIERGR